MELPTPLYRGRLKRRYKRFLADVEVQPLDFTETLWARVFKDQLQSVKQQPETPVVITTHCPNPGSMLGLQDEDVTVWLSYSPVKTRKLPMTLEIVEPQTQVLVNTMRPNQIVAEGLELGAFDKIQDIETVKREVKISDHSRVDFVVTAKKTTADSRANVEIPIEVKGVTLADKGIGYFPDAVTKRGTKHLRELSAIARRGDRAIMLFLVCRPDIKAVRAAANIDPDYAAALKAAKRAGVEILAYKISFQSINSTFSIAIDQRIPFQVYSRDGGPTR